MCYHQAMKWMGVLLSLLLCFVIGYRLWNQISVGPLRASQQGPPSVQNPRTDMWNALIVKTSPTPGASGFNWLTDEMTISKRLLGVWIPDQGKHTIEFRSDGTFLTDDLQFGVPISLDLTGYWSIVQDSCNILVSVDGEIVDERGRTYPHITEPLCTVLARTRSRKTADWGAVVLRLETRAGADFASYYVIEMRNNDTARFTLEPMSGNWSENYEKVQ